jgi:hypothetical protein
MRILPLALLVAGTLWGALPLRAQNNRATPIPATDTFADSGARALVLSAHRLRDSAASGLESYEATVVERTHVGLAITRRLPLRERTLYHREQVARTYWRADGMHRLRWFGRREGSPVVGVGWAEDAPFGIDFDLVDELDIDEIGVDLLFDPFGDRMDVFDAEFVQPISMEGLRVYRFRSGDTMQIQLPSPDRTITLVEVIVASRSESWETVEGSLWFDRDTGVLVRAAYRPSGVWDQEVKEPGSLDDVPGFLKPGIGTVTTIVIEYGLFEQRWWLPRRIFAEGNFDWGHGLVRMPLTVEWTMSDHLLNQAPGDAVAEPGLVEVGNEIRGDDARRDMVRYFAPPGVDLARAPELPEPLSDSPLLAFTRDELEPLLERIEDVAGEAESQGPGIGRMLLSSVRYDRVRGPSAAIGARVAAGPLVLEPHLRAATAIPDLELSLGVSRGSFRLEGYRRIEDASDWNVADGMGNSAATLLFGHDGGDYFKVAGGSLGFQSDGPLFHARIEIFAENHRSIERNSNFSLSTLGGGTLRPNIQADRLDAAGVRAAFAGQLGSDVRSGVINWRLDAEAAGGDRAWGRTLAGARYTGSFRHSFAFALDIAAGYAGRGAPAQREFLIGGVGTIRGVRENAIRGPAFWLARAETGIGLAGLRTIGFVDAGWAGERDLIRKARPAAGMGAGVSFMDGLLRLDVARGISRSPAWRAYFHIDALL